MAASNVEHGIKYHLHPPYDDSVLKSYSILAPTAETRQAICELQLKNCRIRIPREFQVRSINYFDFSPEAQKRGLGLSCRTRKRKYLVILGAVSLMWEIAVIMGTATSFF